MPMPYTFAGFLSSLVRAFLTGSTCHTSVVWEMRGSAAVGVFYQLGCIADTPDHKT